MPRKTINGQCAFCGKSYTGYGKQFCSASCRQKYRNAVANPAQTAEARAKIAAAAMGNTRCEGRVLSEETKEKISQAVTGTKQSPETVAKKIAGWKKTAAAHGGMTPAHAAQLATLHKSGEDCQNWKGGTSYYRAKEYFRSPQYKPFRQSILERDNYTCTACHQRGGKLEIHHVLPYATHPELAFDPSNTVTLCVSCHNKTKKGYPTPRRRANS